VRPEPVRSIEAVFLDRDGVINRKAPDGVYITRWSDFVFLPGAREGLRRLAGQSVPVIVVSNQRGIARGLMTERDLADIHRRMVAAIRAAGGRIDAIYHCPHDDGCPCRKPQPGMLRRAAHDHGFALEHTALLGDQPTDMLAAERVGALAVQITTATGTARGSDHPTPNHRAADLDAGVGWLLESCRWPAPRALSPTPNRPDGLDGADVIDTAC
jgi:D-glycero-D-manno-heptose 1,7-bisphosphate phosphatase